MTATSERVSISVVLRSNLQIINNVATGYLLRGKKKNNARASKFRFLNETETCNIPDKTNVLFSISRGDFYPSCVTNFQVTEFCTELGITVCDIPVARQDDALVPCFLGLLQV